MLEVEAGKLTAADHARLEAWLEEDPANQDAWEDVHSATRTVVQGAADDEIMALRAAALAARHQRPAWSQLAAAACLAAVVITGGVAMWRGSVDDVQGAAGAGIMAVMRDPQTATYRTAVGERLMFALPDGSNVALDTDSTLRVAYGKGERGVRLLKGQALFEVAKGKAEPFRVYAGDRRITAVGTKFNVRIDGAGSSQKVRVALLEGIVRVGPAQRAFDPRPAQAVTMASGEILEARLDAPVRVVSADTERVVSWRAGVLVFSDQPLSDAVAEMNRYSDSPITLADPSVSALRVSGVFRTGDRERFVATISEIFPVEAAEAADGSLRLQKRAGDAG